MRRLTSACLSIVGLSIALAAWSHPQLVPPQLRGMTRISRVTSATEPLLELLERYRTRATFFCVGEVVEAQPELIRRIHQRGHEVAFHGMKHRRLSELGPDDFEAELEEFQELIRQVLGPEARVLGFRAPTFSLDRDTAWALPILQRWGYLYDSSVFPMRVALYGLQDAPLAPYRIAFDNPAAVDPESALTEVPVAVARIGRYRLPVGGGVYFRFLPVSWSTRLLERVRRDGPVVLYLHPWETDPQTPRVRLGPAARLATYHGIDRALGKLERLLGRFRFTTIAALVRHTTLASTTAHKEPTC